MNLQKPQPKIKKCVVDAAGRAPGRVATEVALLLRGKNDANFAPHILSMNRVRVINTGKMKFTGKKLEQKIIFHHSGYPGGLKSVPLKELAVADITAVLRKVVWNMLPKNRLRKEMMKHLTIEV